MSHEPSNIESRIELHSAAMYAALGHQAQLSSTGFTVVFAPEYRLNGRADLSGTDGARQLAHAGIDPEAVTDDQVAAYRAWRSERDEEKRCSRARLIVTRIANLPAGGNRLANYNVVRLHDGLNEVVAAEGVECLERWEPDRLNQMHRLGAVVSYPDDAGIDRAINRMQGLAAELGLRPEVEDRRSLPARVL